MLSRLIVGALAMASGLLAAPSSEFRQPLSRDEKILHALNRLTFGPRPGDVERVKALGLKKWIKLQLHPKSIPENPALAAKLRPLDTLGMSPAEMMEHYPAPRAAKAGDLATIVSAEQARTLRSGTPQEKLALFTSLDPERQGHVLEAVGQKIRMDLYAAASGDMRRRIEVASGARQVVARDLADAKLYRALYSNRQLEEVLTDFWYNHFNVYLEKGADHYLVTAFERDAIRPYVLGKFRDLLRATAQNPAMLFYLDNWQSTGEQSPAGQRRHSGLNENYGRELLELHTLGVDGGYTQKDVTEVARCFTGWTIRQPQRVAEFQFNPKMHDVGEKIVLGTRIPAGGGIEDGFRVLDVLARHPATAHFIARQLAIRFVADDPPEPLVKRMAATFLKKDGELRAVMETMLKSPEFWSRGAYRSKLKSPLEMVASSLRALDAQADFAFGLENQLRQLGEPLYAKAEPTGYSNVGRDWINSAALLARMNFSLALENNSIPGVRVASQPGEGVRLGSPEFQRK